MARMGSRPAMRVLPLLLPLLLLQGCNPDPYPTEEGEILHVGLRLLPKSFAPPHVSES